MTKDVLVSISGAHVLEGDSSNVEVITSGSYYYKNGRHYVIYDEMIDGTGAIKNTIKIGNEAVDVIKSGITRSHMTFEKQKTNISCYVTPYGQMMVGVNTNNIEVDESENKLLVKVDYTLDVNYEEMSRCRLVMDIQSKAMADFHLGS